MMTMDGVVIGTNVITTTVITIRTTTGANIVVIIATHPVEWMAGMTVLATIMSAVFAVKVVSAFPGRRFMYSRHRSLSSHPAFTCAESAGYLHTLRVGHQDAL